MSLLNDALRAAEQRQQRPGAPAAYPGQNPPAGRSGPMPLIAAVTLVGVVVIAAIYWFLIRDNSPAPQVVDNAAVSEAMAEPNPPMHSGGTTERGDPLPGETAISGVVQRDEPVVAGEAELPSHASAKEPPQTPEPALATEASGGSKEPQVEVARAAPASDPVNDGIGEGQGRTDKVEKPAAAASANTAPVKEVRDTPEATDRKVSQELERLIARGRMVEAEQKLAELVDRQAAPSSRYVVAKALLIDGHTERAMTWLPADIANQHAPLRLLRARALLARGELETAVATLNARIPPVEGHVEYRVTLATLLQQQGSSEEAAGQWAELIAWDDSRAPWWVGLAIALESQGERTGAARAYEQAASLPGLAPSLADYVRQRLNMLRAG